MVEVRSRLDEALALARRGFRVFPVRDSEKKPAIDNWPERATSEPDEVARLWTDPFGEPLEHNIGVATGDGLLVLDFDMKPGQHGGQSLSDLRRDGLPETFTVETASGGEHWYYRTPPGLQLTNSVSTERKNKLGRNVDVRAHHGYVVAPGSELYVADEAAPDGRRFVGRYTVTDDRPLADAPGWMLDRCKRVVPKQELPQPVGNLNQPADVARAVDYLRHDAPESIKGAGGDKTAIEVACQVKDFGIDAPMCFDLMMEHWFEGSGWRPEKLEVKVANAYKYGTSPIGVASAAGEFGPVDLPEDLVKKVASADEWDGPADPWSELAPPPSLPVGLLPEVFERWLRDEAELLGVDAASVFLPALIGMSALIPAGVEVQVKQHNTGYVERPILWGALVAPPGEGKTPAIEQALRPVRKVQAAREEAYTHARRAYQAAMRARKASQPSPSDPQPPATPAIVVNDTTTEALARLLVDNPAGLLCYCDELAGWIGGMDAYRGNGASKDRAFWLSAKNGGRFRVDRASRDEPIIVPTLAVGVLGGIQPARLASMAANLQSDGLLQRFLVVVCPPSHESVDRAPDREAAERVREAAELLAGLSASEFTPRFRFAQAAAAEHKAVERFRRDRLASLDIDSGLSGWIQKLEGEWARIALVLHLIEWSTGVLPRLEIEAPDVIKAETARRARLLLQEFFYPHQLALYRDVMRVTTAASDAQWIAGYVLSRDLPKVSGRELKRAYSGLRNDDKRLASAMDELETLGWAKAAKARVWTINPAVHDGRFSDRAEAERTRRLDTRGRIAESVSAVTCARGEKAKSLSSSTS